MTTIYLEVDGQPVKATECCWLQVSACGCICGVSTAESGDEVSMTGEQAFMRMGNKAHAERDRENGFTYRLVTFDDYRAQWADKFKVECAHTPKWGIEVAPIPDGYAWLTTDSTFGRKSYRKHLVRTEASRDYRAGHDALCGKKTREMWRDDEWFVGDCVTCRKCEAKAREQVQS